MESVPKPLDDIVVDFVFSQRRESADLDFKFTLDSRKDSDFVKIAEDIFAMSNYGGGYIVFGFKETATGTLDPVGLPQGFHVDQASLQEKFNSFSNEPIVVDYREFVKEIGEEKRKFAVIYVPPSKMVLKPIKYGAYADDSGKLRKAFSKDEILFRRGTQTIHACQSEIEFIEKRSRDTEYKISLLGGKPDNVVENLYGNFFQANHVPSFVFEAILPRNIHFAFFETKDTPYVRRGEKIYSFCDLGAEPFGRYIKSESLSKHQLSYFFETEDRRTLLVWLLNSEIQNGAIKKGLRFDRNSKNVYFYPADASVRYETWEGRYRKSRRVVAWRLFVKELKQSFFAHSAALISFGLIGNTCFLRILPRIVLTYNGYDTVTSFREGPLKTRLSYNQYNDAYLNTLLFWVSRFMAIDGRNIEFNGRISVCPDPVTVQLDFGIRSDRPSKEFMSRRDELCSYEAVEVS